MTTPRPHRRRRVRAGCLDTTHRNPDLSCPYCIPTADDFLAGMHRRAARLHAEETDAGWYA